MWMNMVYMTPIVEKTYSPFCVHDKKFYTFRTNGMMEISETFGDLPKFKL